jgi:transposase-like protein
MSLEVNMSNQNKQKRPKYTIEFKQDAAKLVNEKGYTHKQAADNLGISLSAIGRWVRAEKGPITPSATKKSVLGSPCKSMQVDFYQRVTGIGTTNKNLQVNAS